MRSWALAPLASRMNAALPDTENYRQRPFQDSDPRVILPFLRRMDVVVENVTAHVDVEANLRALGQGAEAAVDGGHQQPVDCRPVGLALQGREVAAQNNCAELRQNCARIALACATPAAKSQMSAAERRSAGENS